MWCQEAVFLSLASFKKYTLAIKSKRLDSRSEADKVRLACRGTKAQPQTY